jgi:RimJ/RimL family protein N-acetyltransferase
MKRMKLEALTLDQCQKVRLWRNEALETLRTPYPLTVSQQGTFYRDVVCDRNSPHRYWAIVRTVDNPIQGVVSESDFIGMGGITNIQWENRIGEISLIIDPARRGKGEGGKAVDLLLGNAFNCLNLQTVFGECYKSNPAWGFWQKLNNAYLTDLPKRKYFDGKYWDSLYFSIDKEDYNAKKSDNTGC